MEGDCQNPKKENSYYTQEQYDAVLDELFAKVNYAIQQQNDLAKDLKTIDSKLEAMGFTDKAMEEIKAEKESEFAYSTIATVKRF